jgi:serine/threonine protein kinase
MSRASSAATGDSSSDRYHLLELIGCGALGEVHRGLDTATGREVAVRVVDLDDV